MKARERILQIVTSSVAPTLQQAGFRKTGLDFYRRRGEVVQAVQIQLSASNFYDRGHFYINIGLNFDRVYQLEQKVPIEQPKEYQCHFRRRLEQLIPNFPPKWEVRDDLEDALMPFQVQAACQDLVRLLDGVDSIEHFLALGWLNEGAELGLRAQIHLILGNRPAAIRDLQDPFFHSRPNWDLDTWLVQRGLGELKEDIKQ